MRVSGLCRLVTSWAAVGPTRVLHQGGQFSRPGGSTPPTSFDASIFTSSTELTVNQLRQKLQEQKKSHSPRMQTLDTESRMILQMARSRITSERIEALTLAEDLWEELNEEGSEIPLPSRTATKIALCSALRRCALVSQRRKDAEKWTERFRDRARSISPMDFMNDDASDNVKGWRQAREFARPGTGIDQEDLDEDAKEEERQRRKKMTDEGKKKKETPFQKFRQDVMLDHPTVQYAFRKEPGLGPRYTG